MPPKKSDSETERFRAWYENPDNKEAYLKHQILRRIRSGSMPRNDTMSRFNISIADINCIRDEAGLPQIHTKDHISMERGKIRKGEKGKTTYIRCQPVGEVIMPPPTPLVYAPHPSKGIIGGGASTSKPTDSKKKWNVKAIEECVRETMPTQIQSKGPGKGQAYAEATIKAAIQAPKSFYNHFKIGFDVDIIDHLKTNWPKYDKEITDAVKNKDRDYFRTPGSVLEEIDLVQKAKKLLLSITAVATHCPPFLNDFVSRAEDTLEDMRGAVVRYMKVQDKAAEDISDKTIAPPWKPVLDKVSKAKKPSKYDSWSTWQDYLLLMLLAGGGLEMPPVRDNYGRMKIVDKLSDVPEKEHANDIDDYYATKDKQIVFRSMKTRSDFENQQTIQQVPPKVHNAVMASLDAHPRKWLITNAALKNPVGKVGAAKLRKAIGMTFNDARHSFLTWWSELRKRNNNEKREMARMMHTSKVLLEQYIRYGVLIEDHDEAPVKKPMTRAQIAKLKAEKGIEDKEGEDDEEEEEEEPPTPPPAKKKGKKPPPPAKKKGKKKKKS